MPFRIIPHRRLPGFQAALYKKSQRETGNENKFLVDHSWVFLGCLEDMYPHERVSFDSINAKDTEEFKLLLELISQASIYSYIWYRARSHRHDPQLQDSYSTANSTNTRAISARWGYEPRKGMGFVFICHCSSLTPFTSLTFKQSYAELFMQQRQFMYVEIMKLINEAAQWLLLTRGLSCGLHRKWPIAQTVQCCSHNACKEV